MVVRVMVVCDNVHDGVCDSLYDGVCYGACEVVFLVAVATLEMVLLVGWSVSQ